MKMELIPAIDIIDGKCVRLTKGDYAAKTVYGECPEEVAKRFEEMGARRLHVVDLDGAKENHIVNFRTLERITSCTNLIVDFGGGVKHHSDLRIAFESGAKFVTVGSLAASQPELLLEWAGTYGTDCFIVGADVLDGKVHIKGWQEDSGLFLEEFIEFYQARGFRNILCTDISRDGTLQGPNVALYQQLMAKFPNCKLIASGGVSSEADIRALEEAGVPAVVFGKAFYEGRINLPSLLMNNNKN